MNSKTKRAPAKAMQHLHQKRRQGSITVIVALSFVTLCGFAALATDYGQMVWWRNQLQRSCDASALAGASQLPYGVKAQAVAQTVSEQNGVPTPTFDWPNGTKQIRVSATRQINFGFARIIGFSSGQVGASAPAARVPLRGVPFNVPLAITTDDYKTFKDGASFEPQLIDNNRQDFKAGTITALDLRADNSGKSGSVFQTDLTDGYFGTVYLNQQINNSLNASLSSQGPNLVQAITQRINDAAAAPYADNGGNYLFPDYPPNDRRIVTIIVADPNPANNNNPMVTARAIIPVYIESVRSSGNSNNTFLRMRILPSKTYSSEAPGVVIGHDSTPDTGLAVVKLIG